MKSFHSCIFGGVVSVASILVFSSSAFADEENTPSSGTKHEGGRSEDMASSFTAIPNDCEGFGTP